MHHALERDSSFDVDHRFKTGLLTISLPPFHRPLGDFEHDLAARNLVEALTAGGDARITLDPQTGLNRYSSGPYPRDVLAYSSSTVSDISPDAFAHLLCHRQSHSAVPYAEILDGLRTRIRCAYGLGEGVPIAFAPSGTDLEYIALAAVRGRAPGGVHNILLGADEIGSGCIHSAHGRYFARGTALGVAVEPAQAVAGCGDVSLVDIPVRCGKGLACSSAEITEAMIRESAVARDRGKHALVHCVHGSKTGLVLPSRADLAELQRQFGDDATFVIDACQARITSEAIADYIARDCIVLMTGSKFIGAPPFSGWALLPPSILAASAALPPGFANIFHRAEIPGPWAGREMLQDKANLSLALRLEAAVFELERFQRILMEQVEMMIESFEAALDEHCIGPLGVERVLPHAPDSKRMPSDCPIEMRTLATVDVSSLPGLRTFEQAQALHKQLAMQGLRLGQPVKCACLPEGWGGTLRIGLSMPMLSGWSALSSNELADILIRDMRTIAATVQQALDKSG